MFLVLTFSQYLKLYSSLLSERPSRRMNFSKQSKLSPNLKICQDYNFPDQSQMFSHVLDSFFNEVFGLLKKNFQFHAYPQFVSKITFYELIGSEKYFHVLYKEHQTDFDNISFAGLFARMESDTSCLMRTNILPLKPKEIFVRKFSSLFPQNSIVLFSYFLASPSSFTPKVRI